MLVFSCLVGDVYRIRCKYLIFIFKNANASLKKLNNDRVFCMSCTLTRSQELAAPCPDRCPEVGGELLGVLVLQNEFSYGSFTQ